MSQCWLLLGAVLAASLDASSGVIIAHFVCLIFKKMPTLSVYLVGSMAALLPDISIAVFGLCGKYLTGTYHHREFTHYPLLIAPIFLVISLFSPFWGCLASLCLLAHFIDDSFDPGGLAWLAPFVRKKWPMLGTVPAEPMKRADWLRQYYLRPTVKSVSAMILSSIALYLVISQLLPN